LFGGLSSLSIFSRLCSCSPCPPGAGESDFIGDRSSQVLTI
jgi:hypothetical protein